MDKYEIFIHILVNMDKVKEMIICNYQNNIFKEQTHEYNLMLVIDIIKLNIILDEFFHQEMEIILYVVKMEIYDFMINYIVI